MVDKAISWIFTLNKNGQIETIEPTQIWINIRVELAGLFSRILSSSAVPRMENIPINIVAKSAQSAMITS